MEILQVCHRFYPSIGGTEEVVGRLSRGLVAAGHTVTILTSEEPGAPREEEIEGVRVVRLSLRRLGPMRVPVGYRRVLRALPHDILHVHGQRVWPSDALLPFLASIQPPKVFTPHGFYQWHMQRSWREGLYYKSWFARRIRHFDCIVAITEGERETLEAWGVERNRVVVIPQGVDPTEFAGRVAIARLREGGRATVLYVGGFYPNKRVDLLIQSMAKAQVDARLVVVGPDGPDPQSSARCRHLAATLGVEATFLGVVPRSQLISLYQDADILALPSLFEGFGLVLLEAMAAGVPFVSTHVGAAAELARRGAGILVEDVNAMGEAMKSLQRDGKRLRSLGEAGKVATEKYSWDRAVTSHVALYQGLLDRRA